MASTFLSLSPRYLLTGMRIKEEWHSFARLIWYWLEIEWIPQRRLHMIPLPFC